MEYLLGSKEEFFYFVDSINEDDKVAILTHIDLDGLASALFLEKILEGKGGSVDMIEFLDIKKDMLQEIYFKLKENGITKIFISDLGVDSINFVGFNELREEFEVFLIDHHPFDEQCRSGKNIIKTESSDCSALTIYDLGERLIDAEEWDWLVASAIFSDYSYSKEENMKYLQRIYPEVTRENIDTSIPGMNARIISSALIYYENNRRFVYDLVKERNLEELKRIHEIIEDEISSFVERYSEFTTDYPEKNLHMGTIDSKYNIASVITTLISKYKPEDAFVYFHDRGEFIKVSARCQSKNQDMGELMKKSIIGLESATGGGHAAAAAARILKKDLEKFKENILK